MDDQLQKAFDFAQEATKELIALGTGVIALTVTFAEDVFAEATGSELWLLVSSWIAFLVSVSCGAWALLALTGELQQLGKARLPSVRGTNVIIPSIVQIFAFLLGLILTVAFGIVSLV